MQTCKVLYLVPDPSLPTNVTYSCECVQAVQGMNQAIFYCLLANAIAFLICLVCCGLRRRTWGITVVLVSLLGWPMVLIGHESVTTGMLLYIPIFIIWFLTYFLHVRFKVREQLQRALMLATAAAEAQPVPPDGRQLLQRLHLAAVDEGVACLHDGDPNPLTLPCAHFARNQTSSCPWTGGATATACSASAATRTARTRSWSRHRTSSNRTGGT
jgi:hypothetical protein